MEHTFAGKRSKTEEPPDPRSQRAFGSLKYEHLYRHEIDDGHDLGLQVERYRQLFNTVGPHRSLAGRRPLEVHLQAGRNDQILKSTEPETLPATKTASQMLGSVFARHR